MNNTPKPKPLTQEEVVRVNAATVREAKQGRPWPAGWADRIGKPELWRWAK